MRCVVEVFGILRDIARSGEIILELRTPATFRSLLEAVKADSPSLGSLILTPGGDNLREDFILSVNNGTAVNDLEAVINEGDRISLLYLVSGG